MIAVGFQVLLPSRGKERIEIAARVQARMYVAVDNPKPGLGASFLFKARAVDDIAHAILLCIRCSA
jgi:hypothetical protein